MVIVVGVFYFVFGDLIDLENLNFDDIGFWIVVFLVLVFVFLVSFVFG